MDDYLMEPFRVKCWCASCGKISWEISTYAPDRKQFLKRWYCGCKTPPHDEHTQDLKEKER